MVIGLVSYFIPFAFVLNPALVGHGSAWKIIISIIAVMAGIFFISCSVQGVSFKLRKLHVLERVSFFVSGIILFFPVMQFVVIGAVLGIISCNIDWWKNKKDIV